ncbi:MAG: iron ABC transporter permease [Candidatus Pelagadaptatus aseana]|uniref:FecCD family ABC transporter permease n=1 Tax=Candidatus Pelagadaptatus aseana TaxID=3120508 RepID=UPI0039B351E5
MRTRKASVLIVSLAMILPLAMVVCASTGVLDIPWQVSFKSLLQALGLSSSDVDPQQHMVLWQIRWPRVVLAAMVGATLALCGATMQGLFRNPLADPSLIGVSSGASLGAAVAIVLGATLLAGLSSWFDGLLAEQAYWLRQYLIAACASLGGFIASVLVYRLGTTPHGTSVATMLLAGIAITALAAALSNILSFIADDLALRQITLWKMGSLDGANWQRVLGGGILLLLVLVALPRYSRELNALLLGESEARHLGIAVERLKLKLIAWTALGVGVSVSLSGIIGFVGLVVPHLVRLMIGPDHRTLLPASALLGAILLVLADSVSRQVFSPEVIPIGIVTALLGAPFFISLLLQQRQRMLLQ